MMARADGMWSRAGWRSEVGAFEGAAVEDSPRVLAMSGAPEYVERLLRAVGAGGVGERWE